jgi:FlaA1/EpsC-like NDP-sugar epimerase
MSAVKRPQVIITVVFSLALLAMVFVSLSNGYNYWTELISMALLGVPLILAKARIIELAWPVVLLICSAFFMHNIGLVTNWYAMTYWWDKLTHILSGMVIASLTVIVLLLIPKYFPGNNIPLRWFPFFIFISIVALEAFWEIIEFTCDNSLGTHMQYGLSDTANDIATNAVSGLATGIVAAVYLGRHSTDRFLEELKVEGTIARIKSRMVRRGWYRSTSVLNDPNIRAKEEEEGMLTSDRSSPPN